MQEKHFIIQFLKQIDKLEKHIIYHVSKRVESDDINIYIVLKVQNLSYKIFG